MQLEDDDRVKAFIGEFTSTYPVLDTEPCHLGSPGSPGLLHMGTNGPITWP
ncbi:MAG: hypothetical protein R2874_17260 [Desulfobacterales bacterium]